MGQLVEVDKQTPFYQNRSGNGRFTAGNPACQSHIQHRFLESGFGNE
jgi:hypothetical protein